MNKNLFCSNYINYLSVNKTERECVNDAVIKARYNGFYTMKEIKAIHGGLRVGDKVYFVNKDKNFAAFIIGEGFGTDGINLLGAHIDSPRLDIKTQPLYEDNDIAYLDTQYYGGIKKYQWVTRPLALHGKVCFKNGTSLNITIGEDQNDPVFCISDLLPHLDKDDFIKGEKLDLIAATKSLDGEEKDAVKKNVIRLIQDKIPGFEEMDFLSSELEVVPAGPARYCGLDKSLIAGYGQDDRVCAYTSLMALMDIAKEDHWDNRIQKNIPNVLKRTCGCILVDKEEVGSICATGSESRWLEDILYCVSGASDRITFADILYKTDMLSSDVTAAYDPLYGDVSIKNMTAKLNGGFMLSKYNGGSGKSGGADANPEYIALVRNILDNSGIKYQFDTMGKVDGGGGGTIASIVCKLNLNVLDAGVPVLNMHSPMELTSAEDVYNTYLGYMAFLKH
jgi:aspartyl aminopeptidase